MQLLEQFLRGCLDTVKRIEVPNQSVPRDDASQAESGEESPQAGPPAK